LLPLDYTKFQQHYWLILYSHNKFITIYKFFVVTYLSAHIIHMVQIILLELSFLSIEVAL